MRRERLIWTGIALAVVAAGLLIAQVVALPGGAEDDSPFRQWLWERRALDLLVQVSLIIAGALGIAALLPRDQEGDQA